MDLRTPVCDLLGCDVPIVVAGMGGVARHELVAAVAEAGGFGFLGMVRESPRLIRREIEAVRRRTNRPFGVSLVPAATDPELFEAELDACLSAGVHAVSLFWDLAADAIAELRRAGVLAVCQVGSAEEARAAEAAGAEVIVAQGREAGGHVRGRLPRDELLAQVLVQAKAPVLAAGGLTHGREVAAAIAMGAQGAVMGTTFLATRESFAHAYHKTRIVESQGETVHTTAFHINWPPGAPVRVLPNSVTRGERGDPRTRPVRRIAVEGRRPIFLFSTDSPLRTTRGDLEAMALYAGEGAGEVSAVLPAAERFRIISEEARTILAITEAPAPGAAGPAGRADYATLAELALELNTLLEAERAGARVAAEMIAEAPDAELRVLARAIHADEVRWARALITAIGELRVRPSDRVGSFYERARSIAGAEDRLAFVNRGQAWVVRRLKALLPRVKDEALHQVLLAMLAAHEHNIERAERALVGRGVAGRNRTARETPLPG